MSKVEYLGKIESISLVVDYLIHEKFENIDKLIAFKSKIDAINNSTTEQQLIALYQEYCLLIQDEAVKKGNALPLCYVCWNLHEHGLTIIKNLLEAGVDPNVNTPLHMAVNHGHLEAVDMLLCAGAKVNQQNEQGKTALHFIPSAGPWLENIYYDLLSLLLKHNANCNLPDNNGRTPLFNFIDKPDMAKLLIEAGADVNHKDKEGETPRSEAKRIDSRMALQTSVLIEQSIAQGSSQFQPEFLKRWADVNRSIRSVKSFEQMRVHLTEKEFTITEKLKSAINKSYEFSKEATDDEWIQFANELRNVVNDSSVLDKKGDSLFVCSIRGHAPIEYFVDWLFAIKQNLSEQEQALMSEADDAAIKLFFQTGLRHDVKDGEGKTPLFYAARLGNVIEIKRCLKEGANINAADREGDTPLLEAVTHASTHAVRYLIDAKADVTISNSHDQTPLHEACYVGSVAKAELLLKAGADVNAEDWHKDTPLCYAIREAHIDVVKLLLAHGAYIKNSYLNIAKSNQIVSALLLEASKNTLNTTPPLYPLSSPQKVFTTQACMKQLKYASRMISYLVNRSFLNTEKLDKISPKIQAAVKANTTDADIRLLFEEYRMLLRAKNITSQLGENIFIYSIMDGNVENIEHFIQLGFDVNYSSPMYQAAKYSDQRKSMRIMTLLFAAGADPHPPHKVSAGSALTKVISDNRTVALQYFISQGVDINKPDNYGHTPLQVAASIASLNCIRILLNAGAHQSINLPNEEKNITALSMLCNPSYNVQYATDGTMSNIIDLMLKNGAEVNILDNRGRTVLFNMVRRGYIKSAELLIGAGALTDLVDKEGKSLISIAQRNGNEPMLRLLRKQHPAFQAQEAVNHQVASRQVPAPEPRASSCFGMFFLRRDNQVQPFTSERGQPSSRLSGGK